MASRPRPLGVQPELFVVHCTAGSSYIGAYRTLIARNLSYHYLCKDEDEGDGELVKGVPYSRVAYHAGNSYGPREAARRVSRVQDSRANFIARCSVNDYSIGLSYINLNDGKDPISTKQFDSGVELVRELVKGGVPLKHVTTHAKVSPRRKTDPRWEVFDLDVFARECKLPAWKG